MIWSLVDNLINKNWRKIMCVYVMMIDYVKWKKKQWKRKAHQKEWIKKKVGSLVWKIQKSISMWP